MACDCAETTDELLASRNTRLTRAMIFNKVGRENNPDLILRTEQIETGRGKQKASAMFFAYCPFCGVEYDAAGRNNADARKEE